MRAKDLYQAKPSARESDRVDELIHSNARELCALSDEVARLVESYVEYRAGTSRSRAGTRLRQEDIARAARRAGMT